MRLGELARSVSRQVHLRRGGRLQFTEVNGIYSFIKRNLQVAAMLEWNTRKLLLAGFWRARIIKVAPGRIHEFIQMSPA